MPTALEIDVASDDFSVVLGELTSKPALFEDDIERLRCNLFRQGGVDRRRAAEIFHANRVMKVCHGDWSEFYLEALTDFFLKYQDGRYFLPAESEDLILAWLGGGVAISHANERRLVFRILLRATNTLDRIERRILDAVRMNLLDQSERWLGAGQRSAGVVDVLDMQMIRRLTYGAAGQYPRKISRAVVIFLLSLDQHAGHFVDPESWRHLLVDSVARHLSVDLLDKLNGTSPPDRALEARVKELFDSSYSSEKTECLQNDVRAARRWAMRGFG